jgi:cell division protease FtsH
MVRMLLALLVVLVVAFVWLAGYAYEAPEADRQLGLDEAYELADGDRIVAATLLDEDGMIVGRACSDGPAGPPSAGESPAARCEGPVESFAVAYPASDVVTRQLVDRITAGAPLEVAPQTSKAVAKVVLMFVLPLGMLAVLFGLIFTARGSDSGVAEVMGFGRLGRKRQRRHAVTQVTFADVAGAEEAITELREVTDYLHDPHRFAAYGAAVPKGVLLGGQPGCGKTLLARAVAGESGVAFFSATGSDFVESLVGVGAARVRDLFAQVRSAAPAILFIDEIDAVGRRREGEGASGGEREQTVNQLLSEMDGFEAASGVVVMAATNRPDILDPALLRPGRFDRHVTVASPNVAERQAILELHALAKPLADDVDLAQVARRTPGFTGADLANVVNEAALLTIRDGGGPLTAAHLAEAIQRVLHGPQRRGQLMTADERHRLALHESGHALVTAAVGRADRVDRVSIVARGRSAAQTTSGDGDRILHTRSQLAAQLTAAMGGLAAEELYCHESSTTAEDDLATATQLARDMVGLYGMSAHLGRLQLLSRGDGHLGGDTTMEIVSGHTLHTFDQAVADLLHAAETQATTILTDHRGDLEHLVSALETDETLEGSALTDHLATIPTRPITLTDKPHPSANGATQHNQPRDRTAPTRS